MISALLKIAYNIVQCDRPEEARSAST